MYGVLEACRDLVRIYSFNTEGIGKYIGDIKYNEIDKLYDLIRDNKIRYLGVTSDPLDIFIWREDGRILREVSGLPKYIKRGNKGVIPLLRKHVYPWTLHSILSNILHELERYDREIYIGPASTYLIHLLTGKYVIDATTGASLGLFEPKNLKPTKSLNMLERVSSYKPRLVDNVNHMGLAAGADISILINRYMADLIGLGCLRDGCTSLVGDNKIIHMTMVVNSKLSGRKSSPALVLKVGDYKVYGIEGYVIGSQILWDIQGETSSGWEVDIERVYGLLKEWDEEGLEMVYNRYGDEEMLIALAFKIQRQLREFIWISGYRPDVIYVSGLEDRFGNFLSRIADLTGYYLAVPREKMFLRGVYSLLRIYGGRGKFDDIMEIENEITLVEPKLGERRRLEIIYKLLGKWKK